MQCEIAKGDGVSICNLTTRRRRGGVGLGEGGQYSHVRRECSLERM
jgi:hypothetical protein